MLKWHERKNDHHGRIPSQKIVGKGFDWGRIQKVGIRCPLIIWKSPPKYTAAKNGAILSTNHVKLRSKLYFQRKFS
jgi:hypothetical protein